MPTADLFGAARTEVLSDDTDAPVPFLVALNERPTPEVYDIAARLLQSDDPTDRELGALVLRELGPQDDAGQRPFTDSAVPLLRSRLAGETEPRVLGWLISALAYNSAASALDDVVGFAGHPHWRVRFHVAAGLPALMDPVEPSEAALNALQQLCRDDSADTRFYALYALVEQFPGLARERIAETLEVLTDDPDDQVRELTRGIR